MEPGDYMWARWRTDPTAKWQPVQMCETKPNMVWVLGSDEPLPAALYKFGPRIPAYAPERTTYTGKTDRWEFDGTPEG